MNTTVNYATRKVICTLKDCWAKSFHLVERRRDPMERGIPRGEFLGSGTLVSFIKTVFLVEKLRKQLQSTENVG